MMNDTKKLKENIMETKITSQEELYNKVKPALRTRRHELYRVGLNMISENDIWNYNKENNWKDAKGLTIAGMVNDILNTTNDEYKEYVINNIKRMQTVANFNE